MSTPQHKTSEELLVSRIQQRDKAAFAQLYDNYSGALYGVIMKVLREEEIAQDVLQEAFIRIWNKIHTYDRSKGRLFTWMLNVSRNLAIDKLRSKEIKYASKIQTHDPDVYDKKGPTEVIPIDHIGLKDFLKSLSEEQQTVLHLLYFQGFTQAEAAEELNIPLGTVKSRVRLALKTLRKLMQ